MKATIFLYVAALLSAGVMPNLSDARASSDVRILYGAYHEPGVWVQIIPVDDGHAYVHIYGLSSINSDKMTEFEEVTTIERDTLRYRKSAADGNGLECDLTLRHQSKEIAWSAPETAPCAAYLPGGSGVFSGSITFSRRRPVRRDHRYPGEGLGYLSTVAAWQSEPQR